MDTTNGNLTLEGKTDTEWFDLAIESCKNGDFEQAIFEFSKCIILNPQFTGVYNNRGIAKRNLNLHSKAIEDFTRAIELEPQGWAAYNNRGNAKSNLKLYNEAIEDYTCAIKLNSQVADAFYNRGNVKYNLNLFRKAVKDYTRAIELDPQNEDAFYNRGIAKKDLKLYREAIEDYNHAIKLNPQNAEAFNNLGIAKRRLKLHSEAIKDFTNAIELNSQHANAFYNRGNAKLDLKMYRKATEDYTCAIELDPQFAKAHINRSWAYEMINEIEFSKIDFNRFLYLTDTDTYFRNLKISLRHFNENITPFLTRHTFKKFINLEHLGLVETLFNDFARQCLPMEQFLKLLQFNAEEVKNSVQYYHAEALINFYMLDPIKAYIIYDTKIDTNEIGINLMGQYYYIESAKCFGEPYNSTLNFALKDIENQKEMLIKNKDLSELYYAGLINYQDENLDLALDYFELAQPYLPAAYMILKTYYAINSESETKQLNTKLISAEKIAEQRAKIIVLDKEDTQGGYRHGFKKHYFTTDTANYFEVLQRFAHFNEIAEIIAYVRNHNESFEYSPMWESFAWRKEDLETFNYQIRLKEIAQKAAEIFQKFKIELDANYPQETKEKIRQHLEDKIDRAYIKNTEAIVFKELLRDAKEGKDMQSHLGEVFTIRNYDSSIKSILLEFFYLNGNLSADAAFMLYFYLGFTEKRINYLEGFGAEVNFEMSKKVIELLIESATAAASIATAGMAQAFVQLGKGFLQWRHEEEPLLSLEDDPREESYENFKKGFFHFMMVEMEKIGEEAFFRKYPLHGFDDWRRK